MMEKAWEARASLALRQEWEEAEREMSASIPLTISSFFILRPEVHEMMVITLRVGLPSSREPRNTLIDALRTVSHVTPQHRVDHQD